MRREPFKSDLKGQFEMLMPKQRNKGQMCNYAAVSLPSGSETHRRIEEESSIQRGGCRNNAQEARPRGAEGGLQTLQCEIDSLQVSLDL